jgi:hypothetical protein
MPERDLLEAEVEEVAEIGSLASLSARRATAEKNTPPFRKVSGRKERAI